MLTLIIGLLILIGLMLIGVPVAMAFGAMAIYLASAFDVSTRMLMPAAFYQIKSVVLLTAPFFILVGSLMSTGGLAERLIGFVNSLVGRIRGGLGAVTVVGCAMFGSIGGSCSSAVAAIGTIMIPRMEENGYTRGHATALVACSSILGQLIPPSVPMILFALVTYQSIPGCWLATVGPGVMVVVIFCILNYFMTRKMPLKLADPIPRGEKYRNIFNFAWQAKFALLLPVIILGGIYGGIATPTEAACVSALYCIPISLFVYKSQNFRDLGGSIVTAGTTTGVLIIMLFFVMVNTRILTMEQLPQEMASWIMQVSPNKTVTLLMLNVFLLIIGMIMDDISGTILAASLLFPVVEKLGVHPLHFAAIMGVNLGLGNVTPPRPRSSIWPVASGDCSIEKYINPSLILICFGMLPVVLITTYWPSLSLFLPRLFGFVH